MDHAQQVAIAQELLDHIERGTTATATGSLTVTTSGYYSPSQAGRERERIFTHTPLAVALAADIPEPGDYWATQVLDVPVILLRDSAGRARAFVNACAHRGTRLLDAGRGQRHRISCPFHAWGYGLDGALTHVPRRSSLACEALPTGLTELPLVDRHGILWMRLQPGATIAAGQVLGQLDAELASWDLAGQRFVDQRDIAGAMNWKLANDTFGETYHFDFLHRSTLSKLYLSNVLSYQTFGRHHRMVFPLRSIEKLRSEPESAWRLRRYATIAYFLYPNVQLLVSPTSVALYRITPNFTDPAQCTIHQNVYVDPPAGEDQQALVDEVLRDLDAVIVREDFAAARRAQQGLAGGLVRELRFCGNEPALQHYHRTFAAALADEPPA